MRREEQHAQAEATDTSADEEYQKALEKQYWERRRYLCEGAQYHSRSLDNHILTLSAAILAFSAVFMSGSVDLNFWGSGYLLVLAWALLSISIGVALCSFHYGRAEYEALIKDLDKRREEERLDQPPAKYPRAWLTRFLDHVGLWAFVLGLLSLLASGALVMLGQPKGGENVGQRLKTQTQAAPATNAGEARSGRNH